MWKTRCEKRCGRWLSRLGVCTIAFDEPIWTHQNAPCFRTVSQQFDVADLCYGAPRGQNCIAARWEEYQSIIWCMS